MVTHLLLYVRIKEEPRCPFSKPGELKPYAFVDNMVSKL